MKTLICFISHEINDKLLQNFFAIKNAVDNTYDILYVSPNKFIQNETIKDYIVNLNISSDKLFDTYNNKNTRNNVVFTEIFSKYTDYDYYWFIENDVIINNDDLSAGWKTLFDFYNENDSDLIGSKIYKWTDKRGYQLRYPVSLLNKYIKDPFGTINTNKLWFSFLTVCRISNRLLQAINEYYSKYDGFFEYIVPSLAKQYNMKISSFTEDKFDLDLSGFVGGNDINLGSNTWNYRFVIDYKQRYPKNTIIHPIKLY